MTRSSELDKLQGAAIVQRIVDLQQKLVAQWHLQSVAIDEHGLLEIVSRQHSFNFLLWHEEDTARNPSAGDSEIAKVKRSIDRLNQLRNDHIEKLDDWFIEQLQHLAVVTTESTPLNTETPGSAIDRLSIMALRIYHLHEQVERKGATEEHRASAKEKLLRCQQQHRDLCKALGELIDDLVAGNKRLQVYRALKMYNDPTMNPFLYSSGHAGKPNAGNEDR